VLGRCAVAMRNAWAPLAGGCVFLCVVGTPQALIPAFQLNLRHPILQGLATVGKCV
jgi:hypothetical protein